MAPAEHIDRIANLALGLRISLRNYRIAGKTKAVLSILSGLPPHEVALIGGEGHALIPGAMDGWGFLSELHANLVERPGLLNVEDALALIRVKMDVALVGLGERMGRPGTFPVQDGLDQDGHRRMVLVGDHRSDRLGRLCIPAYWPEAERCSG